MKDRTVFVSAFIAIGFHAIILFANIGTAPPTLASAPSALEVTLVAAPAAPAAQESTPVPAPEPEPIPEPEPAVIPERIPEPIIEPELEPAPIVEPATEPVVAPEPIPEPATEPAVGATRRVAREEPGETSEETAPGPPSVDSPGEAAETGGLIENTAPTFDRAPSYTYNPKPKYPRAARRFRREGTVILLVEVFASGRVGEVAIEKSSGHKLLDAAAVKAVLRWRFEPATKVGIPVTASVKVPVEFNLKDAR